MLKKLFALLTLVITFQLDAASVWKVSKDGKSHYIAGSIHMLASEDYPLPDEYQKAFNHAEHLIFETDIGAIENPAFGQQTIAAMSLANGQTLQEVLKPNTYNALRAHFTSRGLPLAQFSSFKPSFVAMTLTVLEIQRYGFNAPGVDSHLYHKAKSHDKKTSGLETPEQQLQFLVNLGQGNADNFILYTLKDVENIPTMLPKMKQAWLTGDIQQLERDTLVPFQQDYPVVYRQLLVNRNQDWLPKLDALFKQDKTSLVVVGALHLAGNDSVLAMLKSKGYKVEKL